MFNMVASGAISHVTPYYVLEVPQINSDGLVLSVDVTLTAGCGQAWHCMQDVRSSTIKSVVAMSRVHVFSN